MSFVGVSPGDQIGAVIAFYELAHPAPLADVVAGAYEIAAPLYSAAIATQRAPRSAEIRHRARINQAVRALMEAAVRGDDDDVANWVEHNPADVPDADRTIPMANITDVLHVIGRSNFDAWDISEALAQAYATARDGSPT